MDGYRLYVWVVEPQPYSHSSIHPSNEMMIFGFLWLSTSLFIVCFSEEGSKGRPYGYALVVGIERAPLPVDSNMSEKQVAKRSRVKPFIKVINFSQYFFISCCQLSPHTLRWPYSRYSWENSGSLPTMEPVGESGVYTQTIYE